MKLSFQKCLGLKESCGSLVETKMPIEISYKIMKIIQAIEREENFFSKKMNEIIQEFGDKKENGELIFLENGNIKIKDGKEQECQKEIKELNELEIELPDYKIKLEDLNNISLSPKEIYSLDPILEV